MESSANQIGFALAVSSSLFIGMSFIVKKKGLMRARASGRGAAAGGYAYLHESLWWIGLFTMIFGEIANFSAYAYAPAILVTPLGALSVIISAILASWMLDERLLLVGKVGCFLCLVGSTVIVLNAPEEEDVTSVDQLTEKIETNIAFQMYALFVIAAVSLLIYYVSPRFGTTNVLVYVVICSLAGSLSVVGIKGLGIAVKLTLSGDNQLGKGSTWFFIAFCATCIVIQMNYLNKALDTFNTAIVTPIYYVLFTTCTIIASAILFNGWGNPDIAVVAGETASPAQVESLYTASDFVTVLCGFMTICSGVFLLHTSREMAEKGESDPALFDWPTQPNSASRSHSHPDGIALSSLAETDLDEVVHQDTSKLLGSSMRLSK